MAETSDGSGRTAGRIVVVGPCASGKTTLANRLREMGLDARVCGQEHSAIRNLWKKMDHDVLVALAVDLETLRARRSPTWPERLYEVQQQRLKDAFAAADVVIDSAAYAPDEVVRLVLERIAPDTASCA